MKKVTTPFKQLFFIFFVFFALLIQGQDNPFNCKYNAYLFQYNDVYSVDLASGNSYLAASDITEGNINAAAYNSADGYIWGSTGTPSKTIVRIGEDYGITTYTIPALTHTSCYIGDINLDGIYFLKSSGTTYDKVDLNPNSETYTQHLGAFSLSQNINIHDWAFNAVDENLYAVEKNSNILFRINPENGTVTSLGEVPILSGLKYTYGAVYFDASGRFYVSSNQTGTVYVIQNVQDLTGTNAINSNLFAFGPSSASNDGARCPTAPVPQEICDNGQDDDGDGLIDCEDASCSAVGDCEVIEAPTSGGNEGGLESNNRLSDKINKRNYNRTKTNYKFNRKSAIKVLKKVSYGKKASHGTALALQDFIPLEIINEDVVIESTPADLLDITNATEVYAVDYMNATLPMASILALKTENGVYEHTKYICDRLLGAELLSVSTIAIHEQSFIKSVIKNTDDTIEFVLSFSAKQNSDSTFSIESHWNLDKYESNATFYNFQIWSNSVDDLYKLGEEILRLLDIAQPITNYETSSPPTVFVRKGKYTNGYLDLEVVNTNATEQVIFDAGIRTTETNPIHTVSTNIGLSDYINTISVETDHLFDIGFRIGDGMATPDDLFMSDGSWGIDDASSGTAITDYEVYQNTKDFNSEDFPVERNVNLEAHINDYVAVYRSLTPRFKPVDISDYDNFSLEAQGSGTLEITLVKKSIDNWENQSKAYITLTDELTAHHIDFSQFVNNSGVQPMFNDVVTLVFKMVSETGETVTKNLTLENLRFSKAASLATYSIDQSFSKMVAIPNPMTSNATIHFTANGNEQIEFNVYNQLGQKVFSTYLQTKMGANEIQLEKEKLSGGLYFCKLENTEVTYDTLKLLIK